METENNTAILTDIKSKARELIEVEGLLQKTVAAKLGISEKTIGTWIIKYQWKKKSEMLTKRSEARQLIVKQGFQQKEAAKMVGVSEKTVGAWAIKYKWKSAKSVQVIADEDLQGFINGLKEHLMLHHTDDYNALSQIVDSYYSEYSVKG